MKKITRKEFAKSLMENTSVFCGSVFRWNDEKCAKAIENIKEINENVQRRTVTEEHATYLLFSDGSRLAFDQKGKYEYLTYKNENGMKFILQKFNYWDDFDDAEYSNYIVYAIIETKAAAVA